MAQNAHEKQTNNGFMPDLWLAVFGKKKKRIHPTPKVKKKTNARKNKIAMYVVHFIFL